MPLLNVTLRDDADINIIELTTTSGRVIVANSVMIRFDTKANDTSFRLAPLTLVFEQKKENLAVVKNKVLSKPMIYEEKYCLRLYACGHISISIIHIASKTSQKTEDISWMRLKCGPLKET